MAGYTPDVIRILRAHGCTFVRQGKGDHQIWYSPITHPKGRILRVVPSAG
jgi:predicted RNA binding protein YcfA (HicA-like mRNA interferase family)